MLIVFRDHPDFGEIAYAKYQERKRIISMVNSVISKFPEQFLSKKKNNIATLVCKKLFEEVNDKFNLI